MQRDVIFFYNPSSGRFNPNKIKSRISEFERFGVYPKPVSDPAELKDLVNCHIIAAGGDGTLHVAINAADVSRNSFTIFPIGSGNDFASHFKTGNIENIAGSITANHTVAIDLLEVNGIKVHNVCGTGFEALVAGQAGKSKHGITALKYVIPVMKNLFSYQPFKAGITTAEGFTTEGIFFMISAGNGKRAGGGFRLFPKASLSDGKLDLLLIEKPGFWQKLAYVWLVSFGQHLNIPVVRYMQTESCRIELGTEQIFQADGDIYQSQTLTINVIPGGLKLII